MVVGYPKSLKLCANAFWTGARFAFFLAYPLSLHSLHGLANNFSYPVVFDYSLLNDFLNTGKKIITPKVLNKLNPFVLAAFLHFSLLTLKNRNPSIIRDCG